MNPEKAADTVEKEAEFQPHVKKAITISILAMVLAFTTLGSSKTTKLVSVGNIQISNTNTLYEFRILRQLVMGASVDILGGELDSLEIGQDKLLKSKRLKTVQETIDRYQQEIANLESDSRRDDDKQDLKLQLNELKTQVQVAKNKNEWFENAEVILQIAIVLVSASIVAAGTVLFWSGITLGVIGFLITLNGFFLLFTW